MKCIVLSSYLFRRSGALHVGDHLLAVDGEELINLSVAEVEHLLTNGSNRILQLEVLPVGHLYEQHSIETQRRPTRSNTGGSGASGASEEIPLAVKSLLSMVYTLIHLI